MIDDRTARKIDLAIDKMGAGTNIYDYYRNVYDDAAQFGALNRVQHKVGRVATLIDLEPLRRRSDENDIASHRLSDPGAA